MNEKEMKALENEETEKVSGGYRKGNSLTPYCDNCGRSGWSDGSGLYPVGTGHLCKSCLKKYKEIMGK